MKNITQMQLHVASGVIRAEFFWNGWIEGKGKILVEIILWVPVFGCQSENFAAQIWHQIKP